ncbi:MAG TPA: poly-gamma-glutamate system protein, partial [Lacipirellulaceae bacterium]|nr:poly-gamma-glutamate system protein [Lacipirellulaceae bacterium]
MKKIYWRPRAVSRPALLLIALISLAGLSVVERWKVYDQQPHFEQKRAAAILAQEAFEVIKAARTEVGPPIDRSVDPAESGLVGLPMSPVTTVSGDVSAKQTSINPNFAAVIVDMLLEAGVEENDVVAIGMSGSFPALNICTYAACETLKVRPLVISSASASQWGANVPALLWPDMERLLRRARRRVPVVDETGKPMVDREENAMFREEPLFTLPITSIACSIGGYQDRGLGLTEEGLSLVLASIERNGLRPFRADRPVVASSEDAFADMEEDFVANVNERMELYEQAAEGKPIKAYINVGGGTISVGRNIGKQMFRPGLNKRPPRHVRDIDGVMPRFIKMGMPVIHLVHVNLLADRYTMPLEPQNLRPIGDGGVFYGVDYSRPLVVGGLIAILASLYAFIRSAVGFRILRVSQR